MYGQQPSPYGQQAQPASSTQAGNGNGNGKGGVPVVPIVIGAVIVVIAIVLIVVLVVKPGSQSAGESGSQPAAATSSQSASPSGSSASASQQASSSAAADKFLGDWKLAGLEAQGVSLCGDVAGVLGHEAALSISSDGTGALTIDDTDVGFEWEQSGDNAITITSFSSGEDLDMFGDNVSVTYKEGTLALEVDSGDMKGSMIFSKDGTVKWMRQISMDDAKKISSEDVLKGTTWNLTGMAMDGVSMTGDADAIGSFMPESMKSTTIKFKKDGTVNFMGEDATWKITDKGNAVIVDDKSKVQVKSLDDDIVVDLSEYAGTDLVMLLSKAK